MATVVVAHGAWSAGWAWKKMHPLMRAAGHELIVPTYTGLGEKVHLASPSVGLETHVNDIVGVIETEELMDVVLVGHSYGGVVATVVADRVRPRLSQFIYLDAFVPENGKCLLDYVPKGMHMPLEEGEGKGWLTKSNPLPPDTSPEDSAWIMRHRNSHPIKTMQDPVRLKGGQPPLPTSYIYCTKNVHGPFKQFLDYAKTKGWPTYEMDTTHSPNVTAPEVLTKLLCDIIAKTGK